MIASHSKLSRKGISLTEILIGIMVLGIGVISLATLFPLGLLKMKRSVNNTRGAILARDAVAQVRIRNMLGMSMSDTPLLPASWKTTYLDGELTWATALTLGPGAPVVIDPIFRASAPPAVPPARFGKDQLVLAPTTRGGLQWVTLGEAGGDGLYGTLDDKPAFGTAWVADMGFSSSDDLSFDPSSDGSHRVPLQTRTAAGSPTTVPYLTPSYGIPYSPSTLERERRYSWILIAQKVTATQTLGPYAVTAIVFYNRDLTAPAGQVLVNSNVTGTTYNNVFTAGLTTAYVNPRTSLGEGLPQIPVDGYVIDVTYNANDGDGATRPEPHHGYVYKVIGRQVDTAGPDGILLTADDAPRLVLTLEQPARANGTIGMFLKGAVGVFEKEVP